MSKDKQKSIATEGDNITYTSKGNVVAVKDHRTGKEKEYKVKPNRKPGEPIHRAKRRWF